MSRHPIRSVTPAREPRLTPTAHHDEDDLDATEVITGKEEELFRALEPLNQADRTEDDPEDLPERPELSDGDTVAVFITRPTVTR